MAVFNSSYRNIIDYRDTLATISQNIVIMFFWLSHRPTHGHHRHTPFTLPHSVHYLCGVVVCVCGVCGVVMCACGVCGV